MVSAGALITDHYLLGSISDFGPATSRLQVSFIRKAKQTSRVTHGPPLGRASFSASLSQLVSDLLIQKQSVENDQLSLVLCLTGFDFLFSVSLAFLDRGGPQLTLGDSCPMRDTISKP